MHCSPCASALPSPPFVYTHRGLTVEEQGEAGKPPQESSLAAEYPRCCGSHVPLAPGKKCPLVWGTRTKIRICVIILKARCKCLVAAVGMIFFLLI